MPGAYSNKLLDTVTYYDLPHDTAARIAFDLLNTTGSECRWIVSHAKVVALPEANCVVLDEPVSGLAFTVTSADAVNALIDELTAARDRVWKPWLLTAARDGVWKP